MLYTTCEVLLSIIKCLSWRPFTTLRLKDKGKCHLISVAEMILYTSWDDFIYTAHSSISGTLGASIRHPKILEGLLCYRLWARIYLIREYWILSSWNYNNVNCSGYQKQANPSKKPTDRPTNWKKNICLWFFFSQLSPQMMWINAVPLNPVKQLIHTNWSQQTGTEASSLEWLRVDLHHLMWPVHCCQGMAQSPQREQEVSDLVRETFLVFLNTNTNKTLMLGQRYAVIRLLMAI